MIPKDGDIDKIEIMCPPIVFWKKKNPLWRDNSALPEGICQTDLTILHIAHLGLIPLKSLGRSCASFSETESVVHKSVYRVVQSKL